MVKMYYGDDADYAIRRLSGTIVKTTKGTPIYIYRMGMDPEKGISGLYQNLVTGEDGHKFQLSDVDLEPVPLGFVNTESHAVYVSRRPIRRDWKQGLSEVNAVLSTGGRLGDFDRKLLVQPILNQYPSFMFVKSSLASLGSKASKAFSRNFALKKSGAMVKVMYKSHEVGEVRENIPVLDPKFFFLTEHLQQEMGR